MADFDFTDPFRKVFLASVGAVATTAEKSQEVVNEFVKKGELTVQQGKALNEELTRKAKEVLNGTTDDALKAKMSAMTPEERAAYAEKVAQMAKDLDATTVEVEAEEDEKPEDEK